MTNISPRIVITGGSGFLGTSLANYLGARGYEVCIVSRSAPSLPGSFRFALWDASSPGDWVKELEGATALVNLAGRSVDCRKTPDNCDLILRSRVDTTLLLGKALRLIRTPPPVWVQMSTAHIYGDPPITVCSEDSTFGYGLAPFVGQAWEKAFIESVLPGMRQVVLRTSFVLGRNGGALPRLAFLARLGLGGTIGNGKQGMSWIHEADMNRLFLRSIENAEMCGAYLATAPNPVSNAEFMRSLRKALGVPIGLPAKEWMVRIGAPLFLGTDPELGIYGRYCVSKRLAEEGFDFSYPALEEALKEIYSV